MGCRMCRHESPSVTCRDTVFRLFTLHASKSLPEDTPCYRTSRPSWWQSRARARALSPPCGGGAAPGLQVVTKGQDPGARPPGLCPQGEQRPLLPQAGALAERGPRLCQSPSLPAASVTHWLQVCVCVRNTEKHKPMPVPGWPCRARGGAARARAGCQEEGKGPPEEWETNRN